MSACGIVTIGISALLLGTPPARGGDAMTFMRDSARIYRILAGDGSELLRLQDEPAFRLGRQGGGNILEGAIFFWLDEVGRPEAAAQVYLQRAPDAPDGRWLHEFTTLSTALLRAEQAGEDIWIPNVPGVDFKALPGAPEPAATAALRGGQLRALARQFKASRGAQVTSAAKGWTELRLLPTPIARYGKPPCAILDGALFAFVAGTDPEVFLFVEERQGASGPEWQFALAPMSCWPLKAAGPPGVAWEVPFRWASFRTHALYSRFYQTASPGSP
jgi:hypothetical protein